MISAIPNHLFGKMKDVGIFTIYAEVMQLFSSYSGNFTIINWNLFSEKIDQWLLLNLGKTLSSHSENMLNCLDFLAPLNFLKARILKLIFSTRMIYIEYISLLYYNCWKFAKFFSAFCSEQPLKSICIVISIKLLFNSYFWLVFIEFEYSF